MTPEEIDKLLADAAKQPLDPGVSPDVREAMLSGLRPVRPLPPDWLLLSALMLIFAGCAIVSAALLNMRGLAVLDGLQRTLIFTALAAVGLLASLASLREMRPAAGFSLGAAAMAAAVAVSLTVFAVLFRNYDLHNLVKEGLPCLIAGLCVAAPTALLVILFLRRGFVLNWGAAGLAAGTLCGLAGLAMLELHCPNLKAIHVMIWHVAVVPVSAGVGFAAGKIAQKIYVAPL